MSLVETSYDYYYAQYDLFDSGVYSREIINMFFIGKVSRFVENLNIGIYSDAINVTNIKLCMMALLTELYLFMSLGDFDHISCRRVLSQILRSYPVKLKL